MAGEEQDRHVGADRVDAFRRRPPSGFDGEAGLRRSRSAVKLWCGTRRMAEVTGCSLGDAGLPEPKLEALGQVCQEAGPIQFVVQQGNAEWKVGREPQRGGGATETAGGRPAPRNCAVCGIMLRLPQGLLGGGPAFQGAKGYVALVYAADSRKVCSQHIPASSGQAGGLCCKAGSLIGPHERVDAA